MTAATIIQTAKGHYGLEKSATEDALFTDSVMLDFLNATHKEFAAVARCYYGTLTKALVNSQASYALDPTVIEPDIYTFGCGTSSTYVGITLKHQRTLIKDTGAPLKTVAAGTPLNFFLKPGNADDQARMVQLHPAPNSSFVSTYTNLEYNAWVYPADLTASDSPELPSHEQWRLIPWVCWKMALLERSRGRESAPVREWYEVALQEAVELREIMRRGEEPPRTANVGLSAGDDAQSRRLALSLGLRLGGG